jgi:hypothetical protein
MISLRQILHDIESPEQEKNAVTQPVITIEDLRNTSIALEKLETPDREIDVMAKFAVLMDMGLEKEAAWYFSKGARDARKAVKQARNSLYVNEDLNRAAKIKQKAERISKETERIEKGTTLGDYKAPIITGAAAVGAYYLGTKKSSDSKKDELKNVARKYYALGRQSSGGA